MFSALVKKKIENGKISFYFKKKNNKIKNKKRVRLKF